MAKPTRRSVLRAGVVLAAAAAPVAAAEQAFSVVAGGMASGLRRSTFTPHVGSAFTFVGEDGYHRAKLKKVGNLVTGARNETRFSLLFQVKGSAPDQGTYRLRHRGVAAMDLFVTPVGGKPGTYEAIVDAG